MIAYTCVGTNDLDKAVAFYEQLFGEVLGASIFFRAPAPGRYPFLCTFPGHWMAMQGEMVVTEGN